MTPERFIEDGDRVLVLMTIEGAARAAVGYPDRTEALEAVVLSE
jgi:hypothetical protein